jgi:hypothetical protein
MNKISGRAELCAELEEVKALCEHERETQNIPEIFRILQKYTLRALFLESIKNLKMSIAKNSTRDKIGDCVRSSSFKMRNTKCSFVP